MQSESTGRQIKVLIVDDSALVRQLLLELLSSDPQIDVVGVAPDPYIAREKIKKLKPDVLTLDIEMPKMDGITFLRNLMRLHPMPVVMVSTLTEKGADITLKALELGAVDYIPKPKLDLENRLVQFKDEIVEKVKIAARANIKQQKITDITPPKIRPVSGFSGYKSSQAIIAVGSSTGGPEALKTFLAQMPANSPPVVIAQHIPEKFSKTLAQRLDDHSEMTVSEATDNQEILQGHAYLAPGSSHLKVVKQGGGYICRLSNDDLVNRHRPSVEVLFDSVIESVGSNAVAVMLTGMGADGAEAMKRMHDVGCYGIAQDESSSVVWGMPGEAVKRGAVDQQLPLEKIAQRVLDVIADK